MRVSSIFDSDDKIHSLAQRFNKKLEGCMKYNHRKVRISNSKKSAEELLHDKTRKLKGKEDEASKQELNKFCR